MQDPQVEHNIWVIWRGKKFNVEINAGATLKDLGHELQKLTNVKADTLKLIVPQFSDKSSKLLSPFSDEHEKLSLEETSIIEGKSIRMMGVSEHEVDEVLQHAKTNLRIAGFDEEEMRLRQRMSYRPHTLKLPQGPYIFCDFRTLQLPGIELNPPVSEALKRMHMLAADPGIISVMNKHRWRVGIMTEMAPVGYVGISPKCILGFNKNHGEEISLRLRTDDLKGFRKYESIKKTLLHELAHMVYSEHDANFYALDKQLNQEAESLDWTRSRSHTLSGVQYSEHYEENFYVGGRSNSSQKLGGNMSDRLPNARTSSVAAAYQRLATASHDSVSEVHEESHPDDSIQKESSHMDFVGKGNLEIGSSHKIQWKPDMEPDPDDQSGNENNFEPSPDESSSQSSGSRTLFGQDFSESMMSQLVSHSVSNRKLEGTECREEPDADYMEACLKHDVVAEPEPFHSHEMEILESRIQPRNNADEPDPDDLDAKPDDLGCGSYGNIIRPNHDDSLVSETITYEAHPRLVHNEPDPDDSQSNGVIQVEPDPDDSQSNGVIQAEPDPDDSQSIGIIQAEPDPDDNLVHPREISRMQIDEPDPDDEEFQRIQDPVTVFCKRLQENIELLQAEVNPTQATAVLQTLFKITRNVLEHPGEIKYRRLRKANPAIQRNVANYKAAMAILFLIGFNENVVDDIGRPETYLVLKRDDPGLLWLAKSSLETCITF
ncbi:PREDICTED: WLM-domain-containing [Prunus dulcis]|uniref:PREDICTED: WLM-domain-containing n=1 Tax=Prunus dulcis TaxID=3755 RepID=A0A5E4EQX5_PRUDU|nr:uncharacterized protein LOC117622702 isoform X1 [Prunus dulcis]VVA17500.1 PREDICTED: WLM-domain-containing [Prunus dulcis]